VQVTIRCEEAYGSGDLTESLYQWLLDEPEARIHADVRLVGEPPAEGDLGFALDMVQLVISSGFSAASLGYTIAQWKKLNAPQLSITVERDGMTVTVSGTDAEEIQRAVQRLGDE
jgi:hypothetical protein